MKVSLGEDLDTAAALAELQRRVEALEQQTAAAVALDSRVASVEARLNAGKGGPEKDAAAQPVRVETNIHEVEATELEEDADKLVVHKLNESIYEVSLLIWLPVVSRKSAFLAALALALNVVIQLLFITVIWIAFLDSQLPSVDSVRKWRVMEGHLLSNMGVDGTSLVSRVCRNDPSLIVSTDKRQLLQNLSAYSTSGSGVRSGTLLAIIVILMWFLTVSQEVEQAVSFLAAVCSQQTRRTRVQRRRGTTTLTDVGLSRKVAMVVVTFIRISLDLLLLVEGAWWLSIQVNVVDLVLNAAALSFILDLDDTLFRVFVTWPMKVLLSEIEPLPKAHSKGNGFGVWPIINVLGSAGFVLLWAYTQVLPLAALMQDVRGAMCEGPQNWVYSPHDSGLVLATTTQPFSENDRPALFGDLYRVIAEGSLAEAGTVQVLASMATLQSFGKYSTADLAVALTELVMGNGCTDFDFGSPIALRNLPVIAATLRREVGNASLMNCAEVWPYCDGEAFFQRIVCPHTCGCSLPRSGLYRAGANRGCPRAECLAAPTWTEALASIPCQDGDVSELAGWQRFWTRWEDVNIAVFPAKEDYYRRAAEEMLQRSCAGSSSLDRADVLSLCGPSDILGSISAFCPVLCNCSQLRYSSCPTTC